MKKYVDADKLIQATVDIPKDLREYDQIMREVPNFNKVERTKESKDKFKYRNKNSKKK